MQFRHAIRFITELRARAGPTLVSKKHNSKTIGRILFFIPVIAVLALVVFAVVTVLSSQSGTLVVEAVSSGRYSPSMQMHVEVTVGSSTQITPFNFTLSQAEYTVIYGSVYWYVTPPTRSLFVSNGKTTYAIATYIPVARAITITDAGFNSTSVTAMHGITPVVWINRGSSVVVLEVNSVGRIPLNPLQNYTTVFPNSGTFNFDIFNTGFTGTVRAL
jgi:hypothetical protein